AALEAAPHDGRMYLTLGLAVAGQQRLTEAVEILRRAVQLEPNSANAWEQLGVVLWLRQDLGSAADALRRALSVAPQAVSASCRAASRKKRSKSWNPFWPWSRATLGHNLISRCSRSHKAIPRQRSTAWKLFSTVILKTRARCFTARSLWTTCSGKMKPPKFC